MDRGSTAIQSPELALLRPTIRAEQSELWASWNPRRKSDAIDEFLRAQPPSNSIVVEANWRDNPWFPSVLEDERLLDLERYHDRYDHIWEGGYAKAFEGAYFAHVLTEARAQNRIGKVAADPLLPLRAFFDLGDRALRLTLVPSGLFSSSVRRSESSTTSRGRARCSAITPTSCDPKATRMQSASYRMTG